MEDLNFVWVLVFIKRGPHSAAQCGLELAAVLCHPPKCWDYRNASQPTYQLKYLILTLIKMTIKNVQNKAQICEQRPYRNWIRALDPKGKETWLPKLPINLPKHLYTHAGGGGLSLLLAVKMRDGWQYNFVGRMNAGFNLRHWINWKLKIILIRN